jgi:thiol-disulfide isomerase/thioredoxin
MNCAALKEEVGTSSHPFLKTIAMGFAVVFLFASVASAQTEDAGVPQTGEAPQLGEKAVVAPANTPIITPVQAVHDFGKVWTGSDLKHTFKIKNTGTAPLKITKVKPACGCTTKGKHPSEIAPGATGEFSFGLNTKKVNGKFTKAITITTNDPKNGSTILKLVGDVQHFVEVTPNAATFGRLKPDSVMTKTLKVLNNTGEKLNIKLAENASQGCFTAELAEVVPGMEYELTVKAQPPYNNGNNRHSIKLLTGHAEQKEIDVTCLALVPNRLELRPDNLRVAEGAKTQSKRRLRFTNNGDEPVNLLNVTSTADSDKLLTEVKTFQEGKSYEVTVTIPANYSPPAGGVSIVLNTDDKETPKLEVPIVATKPQIPKQQQRPATEMLGKAAPAGTFKTVAGDEVNIGGKSDEVDVLFFYASWCGFCKKALPKVEELHEQLQASGKKAKIYAINLDDRSGRRARTEEQTVQHFKDMKLSIPLILDSEKKAGKPFKVTSFPTMFVVGQTGTVEAVHVGAKAGFEKSLAQEIDDLLAGKKLTDAAQSSGARIAAKDVVVEKASGLEVKQAVVKGSKSRDEIRTVAAEGDKSEVGPAKKKTTDD